MKNKLLQCDILVAGGGPAGVATALSAARNGAHVILVQNRSVLGGNASSEVRMHIVGANGGKYGVQMESEARESGLVEEVRLELCVNNPQRSPSMVDLVLYDLCRKEPNLDIYLNTTLTRATVKDNKIEQVHVERQSTEDTFDIEAACFIDATGDGRLGLEAGASFRHGREGADEFGESLAVSEPDRETLGSTLLYQARKQDRPMPFKAPSWARKFTKEDLRLRPYGVQGNDTNIEFGFWWVEWGGTLDTIKDDERIRDELLAILLGVWDFIKNDCGLPIDNWALEWFGFLPGKRESRRFHCLHMLTQSDLQQSRQFEDTIAYGGWPIDQHPPAGVDAPDQPPCDQVFLPYLYDIPLSSCLSKEITNLFFAGRNIGATHVAFASTRVMATCFVMGQGVGTAAAVACRRGLEPRKLPGNPEAIHEIQQKLLRQDAFLLGKKNEDPDDLARIAEIQASSEQPDGPASLILSGVTRSTHGSGIPGDQKDGSICAPPGRVEKSTNRWMSDPAEGFPCSISLNWKKRQTIQEVQITWDSGLHRLLTFSLADGYTSRMQWGRPQPETVKDYTVSYKDEEGIWKDLFSVRNNYQRRRVHRLENPIETMALQIQIQATNGLNYASVVEVRAYPD